MTRAAIAHAVRHARLQSGRSRTDVGVEAGLSHETVRKIELGDTTVRQANVDAVMAALDLTHDFEGIYLDPETDEKTTSATHRLVLIVVICLAVGIAAGLTIASLAITTA